MTTTHLNRGIGLPPPELPDLEAPELPALQHIYTRVEAAAYLRINPDQLSTITARGAIGFYKQGARLHYQYADLRAYIDKRAIRPRNRRR